MKDSPSDYTVKYRPEYIIIGFAFLCWGRLLSMDGIWWDDWAWVWHYFGSTNIQEFMQPFHWLKHRAVGYMLFFHFSLFDILREYTTHVWSILRFIVFTANGMLMYKIARIVMSDKIMLPLLFALFYLSSPVVNHLALVTHDYHVFLFSYLLSVLFSLRALAGEKIILKYYLPSILFSFLAMFSLESFIFFDILRPFLFLVLLLKKEEHNIKKALMRSLLYWSPFLLTGSGILAEALLVPQEGPYAGVYSTGSLSMNFILTILERYAVSLKYIFIKIYSLTLKNSLFKDREPIFVTVALASAIFASYAVSGRAGKEVNSGHQTQHAGGALRAVLAGMLIVIIGLFPYSLTREAVSYGHHSRHGLLAAIGSSLLIPSLLTALYYRNIIKKTVWHAAVGFFIFVGVLQCNHVVGVYKQNWEHQRSLWWQMIWRAPDIKPGTFMVIDMPWHESPGGGSYVLPAEFNLIYAHSRDRKELFSNYAFELRNAFRTDETNYRAIAAKPDQVLNTFRGPITIHPGNLIAASYQKGYLRLNGEITKPVSSDWSDIEFLLSNVKNDRIIYDSPRIDFPFRWIMKPEPAHDWRYYYQKANALSGNNDQHAVVLLFSEAAKAGFDLGAVHSENLLPFIKAFYATEAPRKGEELLKAWLMSAGASQSRINGLMDAEWIRNNPAARSEIHAALKQLSYNRMKKEDSAK